MKKTRPILPAVGASLASIVLGAWALAQTSPPPVTPVPVVPSPTQASAPTAAENELASLRTAHEQSLKAQKDALVKRQIESLRVLEKKRVELADYDGAQRVLSKLTELEKSLGTSAPAKSQAILLNVEKHHLAPYGIVEKDGVFQISKANATIRWDALALPIGNYSVKMTYSVGDYEAILNPQSAFIKTSPTKFRTDGTAIQPTYGGTVAFFEDTSINAANPLKAKIPAAVAPVPEATISLGSIHISSPRSVVVFKALEAESEGVINLKQLELTPEIPAAAAPTEGAQFAQLKDDYRRLLNDKIGGAQRAWLTKLEELSKSVEQSGDEEAKELIKTELSQLRADQAAQPVVAAAAPPAAAKITLLAGDPIMVTTIGEIRLSNNKELLQRLRPAKGARISFKLSTAKVLPGKYMVTLNVNLGPLMGGDFSIACGQSVLRGKMEASPAYQNHLLALPDPLTITAADNYLTMEVDGLAISTGSLCDLKAIHLSAVP